MTQIPVAAEPASAIGQLQKELQKVRHESLIAARNDDYRKLAMLTVEAARLNQMIAQRSKAASDHS
jgi:predicted unusual protein kinase regulating ubiquinone biosynthesis (AarF/ABC1/UbiB family)